MLKASRSLRNLLEARPRDSTRGPAGSDPGLCPTPFSGFSLWPGAQLSVCPSAPQGHGAPPRNSSAYPAQKQLARGREGKEQQYIQVSRVSLSQARGHRAEGEGLRKSEV